MNAASRPPDRKSLPPFEALRVFDAVARLGGIRRAAEWLDRDHAVVSRHLRSIESWTGVQLVERTPAGIILTDAGRSYHKKIARALDDVAHATLDLLNTGQHNRLIIWSTPGFALRWLSRHFAGFERKVPGVDIELKPADGPPDFASHEADLDIRFQATYEVLPEINPALRQAVVAKVPIIAVASPKYLEENPAINTPADLLAHQLLHESAFINWSEWLCSYDVACEGALKGPRLWQGHLTIDAARHGRGIALANSLVASEDLAAGILVDVGAGNPSFPQRFGHYLAMARRDRWDDSLLRKFRRWIQETIARELPEFAPDKE